MAQYTSCATRSDFSSVFHCLGLDFCDLSPVVLFFSAARVVLAAEVNMKHLFQSANPFFTFLFWAKRSPEASARFGAVDEAK